MRTETKWAVIATLAFLVLSFIEKLCGLHTEAMYGTWFIVSTVANLLIFIVAYFMCCREKREHDLGGVMSWAQGFWACAIMTLIYIPISMAIIYVFVEWVSPDFAAYVAQSQSAADFQGDTMNWWFKGHAWHAIVGGLFFSLLFPLFTRRSVS